MRAAPFVLALVVTVGCGGDPAPAPPPVDGPGGTGAAPTGAPGAPGGSGGGGGDGGAPSFTALSLERIDEGGDCAGLVPGRVPEPVVARRDPAGAACGAGLSDGTGAVALSALDADGQASFAVHAADGAARATFVAEPGLVPMPDGWHGLVVTRAASGDPRVELVAFGSAGAPGRREVVSPDPAQRTRLRWSLGADPGGGSLVVVRWTNVLGNHWSGVSAHRFDAGGAPRWPGGVDVSTDDSASEPSFLGGGVSTRGEGVVLAQDSAFLDVSWLDADGHGLAAADQAERSDDVVGPGLSHAIELVPLLDGAVAVRSDGRFRRAYAHLATVSSPLPAWLAERATSTFRFTRGNAGYAVLPPAGETSADCTQRIDLVSPSGRLCGRAVLREEGTGCTTRAVDQGWDGTLVQQSANDACTYRWWPRLLSAG